MPRDLTLEEAYDRCASEGALIPQEKVDVHRIASMLQLAEDDLASVRTLLQGDDPRYGSIYKLYYDALHHYAEALLLFDRVKSTNHQCLFAALCVKHPDLELDWDFFERIRTRRNGVHYYGSPMAEKEWKELRLQLELYSKTLADRARSRLQDND